LIVIVVALAAATQASSGYGFSLILAPTLQLEGGSLDGVRLVNLLSFFVNLCLLIPERKNADIRKAVSLAAPAALFTPVGAWLALHLDRHVIGLLVGIVVLASAASLAAGLRVTVLRGFTGAVLAGATSGTMNALSGVGGPTVALYTANADWPRQSVIPMLQIYFLIINSAAVVSLGLPHISLTSFLQLFVSMAAGLLCGACFRTYLTDRHFRLLVLGLASVSAGISIIEAINYLSR
jgi:uncharacterized membrane protein YfcA